MSSSVDAYSSFKGTWDINSNQKCMEVVGAYLGRVALTPELMDSRLVRVDKATEAAPRSDSVERIDGIDYPKYDKETVQQVLRLSAEGLKAFGRDSATAAAVQREGRA